MFEESDEEREESEDDAGPDEALTIFAVVGLISAEDSIRQWLVKSGMPDVPALTTTYTEVMADLASQNMPVLTRVTRVFNTVLSSFCHQLAGMTPQQLEKFLVAASLDRASSTARGLHRSAALDSIIGQGTVHSREVVERRLRQMADEPEYRAILEKAIERRKDLICALFDPEIDVKQLFPEGDITRNTSEGENDG